MLKRERNLIKMKEVELLAPAGSYEKAKIAFLYELMQCIVEPHHYH